MNDHNYDPEEDYKYDSLISMYVTLIWQLIAEIKDADIEIVSLRHLISNGMSDEERKLLNMEIFSSLYPLCTDQNEFEYFKKHHCDGKDPFNERRFWRQLRKAAKGERTGDHPVI